MRSRFFLLTSEAVYVEEFGSPYDPGSLTGTEEMILLTPQQHGIPMQTSGRKQHHKLCQLFKFSHNTQKLTTLTSNSNASKYLKNEKEVIFSENPYVLYTKDIIFPQRV